MTIAKYFSFLIIMLLANHSFACTCAMLKSGADIVFTGTVLEIIQNPNDNYSETIKFTNMSYIKGSKLPSNSIYNPSSERCGDSFIKGAKYQVHVMDKTKPYTLYCFGNKKL